MLASAIRRYAAVARRSCCKQRRARSGCVLRKNRYVTGPVNHILDRKIQKVPTRLRRRGSPAAPSAHCSHGDDNANGQGDNHVVRRGEGYGGCSDRDCSSRSSTLGRGSICGIYLGSDGRHRSARHADGVGTGTCLCAHNGDFSVTPRNSSTLPTCRCMTHGR